MKKFFVVLLLFCAFGAFGTSFEVADSLGTFAVSCTEGRRTALSTGLDVSTKAERLSRWLSETSMFKEKYCNAYYSISKVNTGAISIYAKLFYDGLDGALRRRGTPSKPTPIPTCFLWIDLGFPENGEFDLYVSVNRMDDSYSDEELEDFLFKKIVPELRAVFPEIK